MATRKSPKPKAAPMKFECLDDYMGRWVLICGSRKLYFGYHLYEISRTCSVRELGSLYISGGATAAEYAAICKHILDDINKREKSVGAIISFQWSNDNKKLLTSLGFEPFVEFPGNEGSPVTGYKLVIRDENWTSVDDDDEYVDEDFYDDEE